MNRILLTCLLLFVFFTAYPQPIRFAVWGDSQFQNPETFEQTVHKTTLLRPDFVIHVGDMIHGYTYNIENARRQWHRFKEQISSLTVPFYPTPGNHDITTREIQPAYIETWGKDKLYYSFDHGNSHFIILNTGVNQNFDSIPREEFNWLKEDLESAKNKDNIFISMHSPLFLNSNYDWKTIHELLKKYPVRGVFSGHYHIYSYQQIDGINYFCLNSSGNMEIYNENAARFHQFLWVTVDEKDVHYAVITRDNIYNPGFLNKEKAEQYSRIFEPDGTVIIKNPAAGVDTTISISINNLADASRYFNISPERSDYSWWFDPQGYFITLPPKQTDSILFHIKFPGGKFSDSTLPSLNVKTSFAGANNKSILHDYRLKFFIPPEISASPTNEQIIPDGKDDEKSWDRTEVISSLFIDKKGTPAGERTFIKLLYNENYIFVYLRGEEPNSAGLSSAAYGDIPLVFGDDDFELYFDTDRDLKTFFRLMVNPAGTVLSSGPEGRFTFKFDVKTFIGKDFWSAEFRIPLKEFKIFKNPAGQTWGFNVRRHRQQDESPQSDWSKMNNFPPYQPEFFGLLHFN